MSLAILVPVLRRPQNIGPLLNSIRLSTPMASASRVLFIADPDDHREHTAIAAAGGSMIAPGGSYAEKIRAGIDATTDELVFLAADDLFFTPGWLPAAMSHIRDGVHVVGVNDTIVRERRPEHATHFLMTREYALLPCLDGEPGPLSQAYSHSFTDDELIATARARGAYAYARDSIVEHRHWMNDAAPDDATYQQGRAQFRRDRKIFMRRSHLWAT